MSRAAKNARAILAQQHAAQVSAAARLCVARAGNERNDRHTRAQYLRRAVELQQQHALEYDYIRRLLGVT